MMTVLAFGRSFSSLSSFLKRQMCFGKHGKPNAGLALFFKFCSESFESLDEFTYAIFSGDDWGIGGTTFLLLNLMCRDYN